MLPRRFLAAAFLLGTALTSLAGLAPAQATAPDPLLAAAKARFAPDRRTVVFDVTAERSGERLLLRGKVHDGDLKQQLLAFAREQHRDEVVDELIALPAAALGDRTFGVVSASVINLRSKPGHDEELGTQALLGMPLRILDQDRDWYYVQTPNAYLGWTQDRVVRWNAAEAADWQRRDKVLVTATFAEVRESAAADSDPVGDVVAGCVLGLFAASDAHFVVSYPDGRTGFLPRRAATPLADWLAHVDARPEALVATGRRFLGVPYLWGGTSSKGMDCSGYTSLVYLLHGVVLPRDASQQVLAGVEVKVDDDFAQLQPGDLLFFGRKAQGERGERVTHVALSLGGARFLHASVDVHCNSLDPKDEDYSENLRRILLHVRRIAGNGQGTTRLADLPYYRGQ